MSPISVAIVRPSSGPIPGIVSSNATRGSARERPQFALKRRYALVEPVDHRERFGDRAPPHLRHPARLKQRQTVWLAQPRGRDFRPHWVSTPWIRLRAIVRMRTRCMRRLSRSRSARSSSDGSHTAGTRSRRHNSASTRASTLSVLHANGARPLTLRASATSTRQPAAEGDRGPKPRHSSSPRRRERSARPRARAWQARPRRPARVPRRRSGRLAHRAPSGASIRPIDPEIPHARASLRGLSYRPMLVCSREALLHDGRPSVMTFHATKRRHGGRPRPLSALALSLLLCQES